MSGTDILGYVIIFLVLGICFYMYKERETFQLKCIVSTVDGNKYCVRERDNVQPAADLLARVTEKCKSFVKHLENKYPDKKSVTRLVKGYNPQKVMETLPNSEYTAYSENKGAKLAFCLNKKKEEPGKLIDEHTLTFVALHELSHIMTVSIGHKHEFWQNFKFLLEEANEAGFHEPFDYKNEPQEYCSMKISDNPYYDA